MEARSASSVEDTVGYALARACRANRVSVGELLSGLDLHVGQEMVLIELLNEDGLRSGELASRLGVEPPTVTKTLGRLESSGLIERRPDQDDARCGRVFLTEGGRNLEEPLKRVWEENEKKLLAGVSEKERRELHGLLGRVRRNLETGSA